MSVKSFTIYKEFNDLIKLLKNEQKEAEIVYAIWQYMFEDKIIDLDNEQLAIFNNLKRPLDKIKTKSKNKLNKIKIKSNQNQNEIEQKSHQDVNVNVNDNVNNNLNYNILNNNIIEFMEENGFVLYPVDLEIIQNWEDNELTRYAIKQTVLNKVFSTKYVDRILSTFKSNGITTVSQAIKFDEEFSKTKNVSNTYKTNSQKSEEALERWRNKNEQN